MSASELPVRYWGGVSAAVPHISDKSCGEILVSHNSGRKFLHYFVEVRGEYGGR
jgi:hypothetical protein